MVGDGDEMGIEKDVYIGVYLLIRHSLCNNLRPELKFGATE